MQNNHFGVFGCALIVAGTAIGAGMLALPVVTGPSGFLPSIVVLIASWAFMSITGLLFVELSIWLKKDVNILTMAKTTCGTIGQVSTWFIYLFLFYCLLVAYLVGGGSLLADLYGASDVTQQARIILFAAIFVTLVVLGKNVVDPINRLLMIGLFLAYFSFVFIGFGSLKLENLLHVDWNEAHWALPVAFTSFGFQGTVPTLCSWMKYDKKKIRIAILLGTSMTLIVYIVWQGLFLGIVPKDGPHGLLETLHNKQDAVYPLQFFTHSAFVWIFGKAFAFCALATSFLGVGIGLLDFLADGLHIKKQGIANYIALTALAFGVPLLFAIIYPNIFIHALGMAGGYGSALLLGLLPIVMVWRAKYAMKQPVAESPLLGNRLVLSLLILFIIFEISTQIQLTR